MFGSGSPFDRASFDRASVVPRAEPDIPQAVSRLSMSSGAGRLGFGVVLVVLGGVLLYFTLVNPVFDPALGVRSPIDERTAAFEVPDAGNYVVYLETADCQTENVSLRRVGEEPATLGPVTGTQFTRYWFDDLCGEPIGTASLPSAGLWTATLVSIDVGNVTVYRADAPPTSLDWELSWLFVPVLAAGLVLVVQGTVEHVRWRRSLRQLSV